MFKYRVASIQFSLISTAGARINRCEESAALKKLYGLAGAGDSDIFGKSR